MPYIHRNRKRDFSSWALRACPEVWFSRELSSNCILYAHPWPVTEKGVRGNWPTNYDSSSGSGGWAHRHWDQEVFAYCQNKIGFSFQEREWNWMCPILLHPFVLCLGICTWNLCSVPRMLSSPSPDLRSILFRSQLKPCFLREHSPPWVTCYFKNLHFLVLHNKT